MTNWPGWWRMKSPITCSIIAKMPGCARCSMRLSVRTMGASAEVPTEVPRRSLEARADYVGAYIMARAGYYDVRVIKQFWRRMERLRSGERALRWTSPIRRLPSVWPHLT
mgnify:CR=1 FL=1